MELAKIVKGIDRNMTSIEKWRGEATAAALEEDIAMVKRAVRGHEAAIQGNTNCPAVGITLRGLALAV